MNWPRCSRSSTRSCSRHLPTIPRCYGPPECGPPSCVRTYSDGGAPASSGWPAFAGHDKLGFKQRIRPGVSTGPFLFPVGYRLTAVAHEAQQEQEDVQEIEIERQGAHDGGLAGHRGIAAHHVIGVLDLLRIP